MASITGSSSPRLELVRSTSFKSEADGGKNLELAMAVSVFKKLQDAGFIGPKTKLADEIEKTSTSKATSFEGRLIELIKDTNGNGKLEIDLDALASSGLLKGSPTAATLQGVLEGRVTPGTVTDKFLGAQKDKSKLDGARGDEVKAYSNGMVLKNEPDAAVLSSLEARAATAPKDVARESIAGAQVLTTKGKSADARELLETAGNALQRAGQFAEAREVFTALTKPPHASVPRQLLQDQIDTMRQGGTFDEANSALVRHTPAGSKVTIDVVGFRSTVGGAAQLRLDQVALAERMSGLLGRKADPSSIGDVTAYFQVFAKNRDTKAVSQEFGNFLRAEYAHSGQGVEWSTKIPQDDRAGRLDELFKGQPTDEAGRRIVDCEGFAYLTAQVLGGIKNDDGSNRFVVEYASRQNHVITAVSEPVTNELFTVNNDKTSMPERPTSETARRNLIGKTLCGDRLDLFAISRKQSLSEPAEHHSGAIPREGSLVWNGKAVVGELDSLQTARYRSYRDNVGLNANFGTWIRDQW